MSDDMSRRLIDMKMRGQYGLAPKKWREQLEAIRRLPTIQDRD